MARTSEGRPAEVGETEGVPLGAKILDGSPPRGAVDIFTYRIPDLRGVQIDDQGASPLKGHGHAIDLDLTHLLQPQEGLAARQSASDGAIGEVQSPDLKAHIATRAQGEV